MGPSVPQGIHFSSNFLAFITKYSNYFLIIVKHLKIKFKENLDLLCPWKGKRIDFISFPLCEPNETSKFFYGKVVDCYILQRKIVSGIDLCSIGFGGGMDKNKLRSRNEIYNCVLRLVDK